MDDGNKQKHRPMATVEVPSEGGEEKKEDGPPAGPAPAKEEDKGPELSEEDLELKNNLEMAVERVKDASDAAVQKTALEYLGKEVREATSSMTSVPKPLKFLSPFYDDLKAWFESGIAESNKKALADLLSTLGMVKGQKHRETLKYKLLGNTTSLGSWGHEYVRHLAGEVGQEYADRSNAAKSVDDLLHLVRQIVPFHMAHNAEAEAIDLLLETGQVSTLATMGHVDQSNFTRVCLYLLRCGDYLGDDEEAKEVFSVAYQLYFNVKQYADAVRVAIKLDDNAKIQAVFDACDDGAVRKQLAYILGRHGSGFDLEGDGDDVDDLIELIGNQSLAELFSTLARELDVTEAKTPEDIYKSHLAETGSTARNREAPATESARGNLASTFVNAFVNAGYTTDKLITPADSKWIYRNKDDGVMSVTASLGMILQWNVEELSNIDKYLEDSDKFAKAGGLLAVGIACANVRNEFDPAKSVLEDYLDSSQKQEKPVRIGALLGIGLAYAGSRRDDISALLTPFIADTSATADMEIVSMAGLALGLVHTGSANADAAAVIVERLMDASPAELNNPLSLQLGLGLGLLFLGRTEAVVAVDASLDTVDHPCAKTLKVLMNSLAYAGTGNVLKVQEMLHVCAEHPEGDEEKKKEQAEAEAKEAAEKKEAETGDKEKDDSAPTDSKFMYQSMAVLGLSLVVMGEDLGSDMLTRTTEHLLAYGDPAVRRAVPLALALCHVSSADYGIIDTLSKLSHDTDEITAVSAILALGLVTAGTNNSRAAGLLRSLSVFYEKQPHALFTTRLAQGLLHMGKGLMSLNPFHSEGLLMSPQGIGGLMVILTAFLNPRATILGTHHYLMYAVSIALRPRCLMMISDEGEDVHVDVRVGDALDLVGTAGSGKRTVSGFQTHSSPVLLNAKQRAELASEDYEALSQTLEGVVVVRRKAKEDESSGAGAGAAASS